MKENYYKIDEVAVKTGLTKRCLRYYEDMGLVVPKRTACSYRLYTDEDVENIERIKDLRDSLGFSLKEAKNFLLLRASIIGMFQSMDISNIDKYIDQVKLQVDFINKKEKSLERVKKRCCEVLEKLEKLK